MEKKDKKSVSYYQKKMNKLLEKSYYKLTLQEKTNIISYRYNEGQKITYEEFVILLFVGEEIDFIYKDTQYYIIHSSVNVTSMFITKLNGEQNVPEKREDFSNIFDLLNNFRIDGKKISEIWDEVNQ